MLACSAYNNSFLAANYFTLTWRSARSLFRIRVKCDHFQTEFDAMITLKQSLTQWVLRFSTQKLRDWQRTTAFNLLTFQKLYFSCRAHNEELKLSFFSLNKTVALEMSRSRCHFYSNKRSFQYQLECHRTKVHISVRLERRTLLKHSNQHQGKKDEKDLSRFLVYK